MTAAARIDESPLDDAIAEQAADWLIRLAGDDADPNAQAAFDAWKRSDPRHAEAALRMAGLIERIQGLRAVMGDMRPARAALKAVGADKGKRPSMRRMAATLALLLTLAVPGWLALRAYPPAYLLADMRTATGQTEARQLADNTHVTLKGASAINLHYDAYRRTIELVRGEILLDVARDAQRPFVVTTKHGSIRALGTRFAVRCDDDATILTMLESKVAAGTTGAEAGPETVVVAGQRVRIDAAGVSAAQPIDVRSVADAWEFNQLVVRDAPLPDVLDELALQRVGFIRYDRAALADVRVSAVLPLGDTDQALRLLATSHRLRIDTFSPWLVSVTAPVQP